MARFRIESGYEPAEAKAWCYVLDGQENEAGYAAAYYGSAPDVRAICSAMKMAPGQLALLKGRRIAYVSGVELDLEARDAGWGGLLIDCLLQLLSRLGCTHVYLHDFSMGRRWHRAGFKRVPDPDAWYTGIMPLMVWRPGR